MAVTVKLPTQLRETVGGASTVESAGATVEDIGKAASTPALPASPLRNLRRVTIIFLASTVTAAYYQQTA